MAFVLIQHLAPGKESYLAQILSRSTRLPVTQATDGVEVLPDHVYVIPPGVNLAMFQGKLHLMEVPAAHSGEPPLPVDYFFRSLARDCGAARIGVVLSGTGIDGTLGLQEIQEAGGITFAQDPRRRQYEGMPRSASAAGCVDSVLAPERDRRGARAASAATRTWRARASPPPRRRARLSKLFLADPHGLRRDLTYYKSEHAPAADRRGAWCCTRSSSVEDYVTFVQGRRRTSCGRSTRTS